MMSWLIENQYALYFYAVIILIIIYFRKKIEWQGPGVGLYKTRIGVKLMKKMAEKHRELFRWLGYVGTGVGFAGMAFIIYTLIIGLWKLIFVPNAPAVIAPVIPGFNIPGVGIKVPLITGWLALFVVVVIHEFSHGVVSKAHKIPVESSGLLIFGPILGAFVEPNEKKLSKAPDHIQYSVFAAGPFSNILSAILFAGILALILIPIIGLMTTQSGVTIVSVTPNSPAAEAGLKEGILITQINDKVVRTTDDFIKEASGIRPGEVIRITADKEYEITAGEKPDDQKKGYLGVSFKNTQLPKNNAWWYKIILGVISWLKQFITWVVMLSLGIGLANLLPLGPVDGGRMLQIMMTKIHGKKKGTAYWKLISKITLVVILILLIVPIIKGII